MIHIYDNATDYSVISSQTHHSSTITALKFTDVLEQIPNQQMPVKQIDLISSGADRNMAMKRLDRDIMASYSASDFESTKQDVFKKLA